KIVGAFASNLRSAIDVGMVPFQLTHAAVMDRRFSHHVSAEQIRLLEPESPSLNQEKKRQALATARTKFAEMQKDQKFVATVISEIITSLSNYLDNTEFCVTADELLRQVAVMIWGAIEVLATDVATEVLNLRPEFLNDVTSTEVFKRMGITKAVPVETLHAYG